MTKEEYGRLVAGIKILWPRDKKILEQEASILMWYEVLKDLPYQETSRALQRLCRTMIFAPSVAEIRAEVMKEVQPEKTDGWSEGWLQVQKAISRFGMYREEEALNSLGEIAKISAKRIGWKNICTSENPAADRANFRDIYKTIEERRRIDASLGALRIGAGEERRMLDANDLY